MSKRDYYDVLGIEKGAGEDEIKKAYRNLARQFHPDINKADPQAETKFKEINEAYEVLSDSQKRAAYDQFGHAGVDPQGAGAGEGFGGFGFEGFGDIFDMFFGGGTGRRRGGPQRGADVRMEVSITLNEAVFGTKKSLDVPLTEVCPTCHGNRAKPGTPIKTCSRCGGSGQVRVAQQTAFGQFVNVRTCEQCGGEGKVVETPCPECGGKGMMRNRKRIEVTIPAGIQDGGGLRIAGAGHAGTKGGGTGDLIVVVRVQPHRVFERQGDDLFRELTISMTQAALGAKIAVETIDGQVELQIPEGTQSGNRFRIRGQGVTHLGGRGRGDLHVRVQVAVPTGLSKEQRELLKELARTFGESSPDDGKGLFGRKKDAYGK